MRILDLYTQIAAPWDLFAGQITPIVHRSQISYDRSIELTYIDPASSLDLG